MWLVTSLLDKHQMALKPRGPGQTCLSPHGLAQEAKENYIWLPSSRTLAVDQSAPEPLGVLG